MGRNDLCFCGSGKKHKKCHSNVESDSVFADVFKLYNNISVKIHNETKFDKLKCKKGCAECCYQHFLISSIEFYYILHNILNLYGKDKLLQYVNNGYEMWLEYESQYPEKAKLFSQKLKSTDIDRYSKLTEYLSANIQMFNSFPCPFLNKETNSCDVYEYRPAICREYGVAYTDKHKLPTAYCSHTLDEVKYEDYMSDISVFKDELLELNVYKSQKHKLSAMDRSYPIFYFCKIAHNDINNVLMKISEFRTLSKEELSNRKIERALKK